MPTSLFATLLNLGSERFPFQADHCAVLGTFGYMCQRDVVPSRLNFQRRELMRWKPHLENVVQNPEVFWRKSAGCQLKTLGSGNATTLETNKPPIDRIWNPLYRSCQRPVTDCLANWTFRLSRPATGASALAIWRPGEGTGTSRFITGRKWMRTWSNFQRYGRWKKSCT